MDAIQTVCFDIMVEACLGAKCEYSDYGVSRSPSLIEYTNIDYADSTVDIAGVTVRLDELPKELRNALLELAYEEIQEGKWE